VNRHVRDGLSVLALLSTFGSAACFVGHSRERPPTWPGPAEVRGDACPDLSGTFQDEALSDPFVPQSIWLSNLVSTDRSPRAISQAAPDPTAAARRVTIGRFEKDATTGEVRYTAHPSRDHQPPAFESRQGARFECRDGSLIITPPGRGVNANVCGAWTTKQLRFWRTGDGNLVVRSSSLDFCFGLAFILAWDAEWYRFRPTAPPAGGP
jgi:hypothetical protein